MTTCKECASEISETEAFCPFCGIKIESAVEVSPAPEVIAVDPEFDSTIVITPGEIAAMKEQIVATPVEAAPPPSPFDPPPPASFHRTAPTLEDIPAPSILSGGFARPTDPGFTVDSEAVPTKESPVFDEQVVPDPAPEPVAEIPVFAPAPDPEPEPEPELVEPSVPTFEPAESVESVAPPPVFEVFEGSTPSVPETVEPPIAEPEEPRPPTFELAPLPEASGSEPVDTQDELEAPPLAASAFDPPVAETPVFEAPEPEVPLFEPVSSTPPAEEIHAEPEPPRFTEQAAASFES